MFALYNLLQLLFIIIFFPIILGYVLAKEKYRSRIGQRLGFRLQENLAPPLEQCPTIWLHALSVGEVTSAVPLVKGLREKYPNSRIIVSVTTQSGKGVAVKTLSSIADSIVDGPLDILPVIKLFLRLIQPDLYILVETDFWPNMQHQLALRNTPSILVNGRVSDASMAGYQKFQFFFRPMFTTFSSLFMQTEHDRKNMIALLGDVEKIHTIGNLKYDTAILSTSLQGRKAEEFHLPDDRTIFIAGSTHQGEEQFLIDCYMRMKTTFPELYLIIAPRDHKRAKEIMTLVRQSGLSCTCRSQDTFLDADVYLLDTIGELIDFYRVSDIAFVGGSLVSKGGHNPIEPAAAGIPVLFGPDMTDFREISESLLTSGGAHLISDQETLEKALSPMLSQPELREKQGKAAKKCVQSKFGVVNKHIQFIDQML